MEDNEENIDKFIKKSIAYYDVQYDETHWAAMEKRLDADMPVVTPSDSGLHYLTIVVSALGGMILMLGILWMTGVFENNKGLSVKSGQSDHQSDMEYRGSSENVYAGSPSDRDELKDDKSQIVTTQNSNNRPLYASNDVIDDGSGNNLSGRRIIYYMPMTGIPSKGINYSVPANEDVREVEIHKLSYTPLNRVPITAEENKKDKVHFGVSLGFAPDFNGVDEPLGKSVSGLVGFQVLATYKQRFGIMTGLYYSKKKYNTEGENYFPPTGYWNRYTNGVIPAEVIGTSTVIDIPVNLTYNWNHNRKLQFVTGVGVSSYFILNEDCWYKFDQYNPGSAYGWDTEEMVKQMWGVGNVSLGILWYLNPKINIRVEPYLKVPFSDFGWGRIDLYSTGTLVSLQYTFN